MNKRTRAISAYVLAKQCWDTCRSTLICCGLLLSITTALADIVAETVATDAQTINGFDLFRNGLYWSAGIGRCSPPESYQFLDIGVCNYVSPIAPVVASPILTVFTNCQASLPNVVRDDNYVYFTDSNQGRIYKKAVNLPATELPTEIVTRYSPLPPGALGPIALWKGTLYWTEYRGDLFWLFSMDPDGSNLQFYGVGPGTTITKMVGFSYRSGASFVDALFILVNGNLIRFTLIPGDAWEMASGISDFAIRNESVEGAQQSFNFTTVYAAVGTLDPARAQTSPGQLLTIDAHTGATTTIYNSSDYNTMNQLSSVTVDGRYVFFTEAPAICDETAGLCSFGPFRILRQSRPPDGNGNSSPWEIIAGLDGQPTGGDNLRSDDQWWLYYRQDKQISRITRNVAGVRFAFDLYADHIEVVQTTQDLLNDVRLVTKKPTFVRGYAYLAVNNTGPTTFFPQASLRAWLDGRELLDDPPPHPLNNTLIDSVSDLPTRRGNLNRSFLFQLPDRWVENSGNLVVQMTVNPNNLLHETGSLNNTVSSQSMQLIKMGSPCLVMLPVDVTTGPVYWPQDDADNFGGIINRTRTLLPVEDFQITLGRDVLRKPVFYIFPYPDVVYRSFTESDLTDGIGSALDWLSIYNTFDKNPAGCGDTHFVGMCPTSLPDFNGVGRRPGSSLLVTMRPGGSPSWQVPEGGFSLAHELAHNFGEKHVYNPASCGLAGQVPLDPFENYPYLECTMGPIDSGDATTYGYDPISGVVITPSAAGPGDLMSYESQIWMSKYTIDFLFGRIPGFSFANGLQLPQLLSDKAQAGSPLPVLLIHGALNPTTGAAEFLPLYQLPSDAFDGDKILASMNAAAQQSSPPYLVRLVDAGGTTLLQTPLVLSPTTDGPLSGFVQFVWFQPATHRVQLVTSNGIVLADRLASPNAPILTLGSPVINPIAQTLDLNWTASDADGDPLLFTIQYSPDAGTTWQTMKVGYPFLAATFDTRMLAGSALAQVRVIATDGFNSTMAVTAPFSLAKHAPEMIIAGVKEGQHLPFGSIQTLTGMALDAEQGGLPSSSLVWNLTGPSPRSKLGGSCPLVDLVPGSYAVTLSATDADRMSGLVSRHFEILPLVVPTQDPTPVLDGACSDPAYASASFVRFPMGNGQLAPARLVHSAGNLYVTFSDLPYASGGAPPSTVGLEVRSTPSSFSDYRADDAGFYVDENGTPLNFGPAHLRSGRIAVSPPLGFAAVISRGANSWSAEMQISDSLLAGWDHAVALMFSQNAASWPPSAEPTAPLTWAAAFFGTPPALGPTNSQPSASAGPDRTYNLVNSETIFLDGTASFDPNGFPLTYAWTQISGPSVSLANPTSATPSFVAVTNPTTVILRFQLVVNNGGTDSAPSETQVSLRPTTHQTLPPHPPLIVTTTGDSGDGSLRLAILHAWPGETINFAPGVNGQITLLSELRITKNVSINGPCGGLTISGADTNRVFHITGGVSQIANLRIVHGHASGGGGGILMDGGSLILSNCTIADCYSFTTGGGGIYVGPATLTLVGCTVSGNGTAAYGGGLMLFNGALVSLLNSTISGNGTFDGSNDEAWGGGIFVYHGTLDILNCTIANNSSVTAGGGVYRYSGVVTVGNSLIAQNHAPAGPDCKDGRGLGGAFVSSGYNLVGNASGSDGFGATGDQLNLDPRIGPLAGNGGPTFTHALLAGSPAIDRGTSFGFATDQRGRPRPYDFAGIANASGGDGSDIGAFEALAVTNVQYSIIDLGGLPGGGSSQALGVNNHGQIIGTSWARTSNNAFELHAVRWESSSSPPVDLGPPSEFSHPALAINDCGMIVGATPSSGPVYYVNDNNLPLQILSPPYGPGGGAYGINGSGQIVGDALFPDSDRNFIGNHAVLWTNSSSPPLDLGTLGGTNSFAYAINDSGLIVGRADDASGHTYAGFWTECCRGGLGTLPLNGGGVLPAVLAEAFGVNGSGQVVGYSLEQLSRDGGPFNQRAAFWAGVGSSPVALSNFGSATVAHVANAINASGQIVGWADTQESVIIDGAYHYVNDGALLWPDATSQPVNLNNLLPPDSGWILAYANAINDWGEIVGAGSIGAEPHAFALIPSTPDGALRITSVVRSGNELHLSFTSQTGHSYTLLSTSDLASGVWSALQSGIPGTGATLQVIIPNAFVQPRQFYRIQQAQ